MKEFDLLLKNEHNKAKIYISYGLVMNQVQEIELSMIQTYYSIKLKEGKIKSHQDKAKIYTNRLKDTFGSLITILADTNYLNDDLLDKLRKIKKLRDNLAHTFFKEHLEEMNSVKGRDSIVDRFKFSFNYIVAVNALLEEEMTKIFRGLKFAESDIESFVKGTSKDWLF